MCFSSRDRDRKPTGGGATSTTISPVAGAFFEEADDVLKRPITRLLLEGRMEEIKPTENLQPAISLVNAACLEAVRERGYQPQAVAGHSLGEFTAVYAAGVFDFADLARLTQARGRLMARSAASTPGTMLAIGGLAEEQVHHVVGQASTDGVICIANLNADDQVVLSGEIRAIEKAADLARAAGAQSLTQLKVSGAWHSPLMSGTRSAFQHELDSTVFRDATVAVYSSATAEPTQSGVVVRDLLLRQYDSSVRWSATIKNLIRDYPDAHCGTGTRTCANRIAFEDRS